jgi:hypothetical protein
MTTIVTVETLIYSLGQDKLIWAGQSQTTNPSKVGPFIREMVTPMSKHSFKQLLGGK